METLAELVDYVAGQSYLFDEGATGKSKGLAALNSERSIQADPLFKRCIEVGLAVEASSHGTYCLGMGRLNRLWKDALETKALPDAALIESYRAEAASTKVKIEGDIVSVEGTGLVDLGSLAKGVMLDAIKEKLSEKGITQYLVDAGTSSLLIGSNPTEEGTTKVNLIDAPGKSFKAKDCSVSVSSVSRQEVTIGGKRYSHIVDPRTGSAEVGYDALILKGDDAGYLDAYSTAYLLLGPDYLNELENKGISTALTQGGQIVHATASFLS